MDIEFFSVTSSFGNMLSCVTTFFWALGIVFSAALVVGRALQVTKEKTIHLAKAEIFIMVLLCIPVVGFFIFMLVFVCLAYTLIVSPDKISIEVE